MKRNYLLLFTAVTAVSFFAGCKKEDTKSDGSDTGVAQVQNVLVVEPTATWCGPCGQSGKPATDRAIAGKNNISAIYAHLKAPASDLGSQTGQDLAVMYGAANATGTSFSIPKIAVGNKITGAYTSVDYTVGILEGWINEFNGQTSVVNTKIEASVNGTELKVKTNTKFFEAGEAGAIYKISVILTEDNIANRQAVGSAYQNIIHNHVARATISTSTAGDALLSSGVPTSGQMINGDYTYNLNSAWKKSDLVVIAIIWKEVGGKLTFINVDQVELD
jgi:hypothetical protein